MKKIDAINNAVIKKLKKRAQQGYVKYGLTMDRTDLSELAWLNHAQQEAMDFAVYLEKLIQTKSKQPIVDIKVKKPIVGLGKYQYKRESV